MKENFYPVKLEDEELTIATLEQQGEKKLLFFIHGLGCLKESFIDAFSFPDLEEWSLAALDLPGFGISSKPVDFSYTMEAHANVCLQVLENFPHHSVHLAAHSMGGAIGLILAESLGERLSSFINIEGNLITEDCSMSRLSSSLDMEKYRERMLSLLATATAPLEKGGVKMWHSWIQKSGAEGLYLSASSLAEWSCSGRLLDMYLDLKCRKTFIHGEMNAGMPVLRKLRGTPVIEIPDSGHFPMIDNSPHFYHDMADFLNKNI